MRIHGGIFLEWQRPAAVSPDDSDHSHVSFMFMHHIASLAMSDTIPHMEGNHSGSRVAELEKLP